MEALVVVLLCWLMLVIAFAIVKFVFKIIEFTWDNAIIVLFLLLFVIALLLYFYKESYASSYGRSSRW
jgi:hypothetical protein